MAIDREPLPNTILELAARADAGQKLGMQALEFTMQLANRLGQRLDLKGAAKAMEEPTTISHLTGDAFVIEQRSREITADILREFARQQRP